MRLTRILLAALALYALAILAYQLSLLLDADYLAVGVQALFKYQLVGDPAAFADDYLAGYANAFRQPYLYDRLTRVWLAAGGDLVFLHRLISLACWLAFLAGLALAARRLGDGFTIAGALALAVAQPLYLHQITAAVPHAFAFPLVIWMLVALLHGAAGGLACLAILSGLLYPAVAPIAGMLLAWQLLAERPVWRGSVRALAGGFVLLAVTGVIALWLVLDFLQPPEGLGVSLRPGEQAELYPENGPEGYPSSNIFDPLGYVASVGLKQFRGSPGWLEAFLFSTYALVGLYGLFALPRHAGARRAVVVFLAGAALYCIVVAVLKPHLFYRFILYPAGAVLPLLFVAGLRRLCHSFAPVLRWPDAAATMLLIVLVSALDSFHATKLGYRWQLGPEERRIARFAETQPPGTRFAAWPGNASRFEWIPYVTGQPLLVMAYLHQPTYVRHIIEMRARMTALIEAYLATDDAALRDLQCRWQVDYLIVEKAHFERDSGRPGYFAPFDTQIERIWRETPREAFLLRAPDPSLVALETGRFVVVALPGPCASG